MQKITYRGTKSDFLSKFLPHKLHMLNQIIEFKDYFTAEEFAIRTQNRLAEVNRPIPDYTILPAIK